MKCEQSAENRKKKLIDPPSVGLTCSSGTTLTQSGSTWFCTSAQRCALPPGTCGYTYDTTNFGDWFADAGCVDSSFPNACCPVISYGIDDYYDVPTNIKIY